MNHLLASTQLDTITSIGPFGKNPDQAATTFSNIGSTIFGLLTAVAGLAFILYFILGALNWIQAGGDQQRVDKAKNQLTSAAIGLVIVVTAYAIIGVVGMALGFDLLDIAGLVDKIDPN